MKTNKTYLKDKKVADVLWVDWGDEDDPSSVQSLLMKHAPVQHNDDCQFTMFCMFMGPDQVKGLREWGFPDNLIAAMCLAHCEGYHWICFHS